MYAKGPGNRFAWRHEISRQIELAGRERLGTRLGLTHSLRTLVPDYLTIGIDELRLN